MLSFHSNLSDKVKGSEKWADLETRQVLQCNCNCDCLHVILGNLFIVVYYRLARSIFSAKFCKVLQGSVRFCKVLQDSACNLTIFWTIWQSVPSPPERHFQDFYISLFCQDGGGCLSPQEDGRGRAEEKRSTPRFHIFLFFQFTFLFSLSVTYLLFHGIWYCGRKSVYRPASLYSSQLLPT